MTDLEEVPDFDDNPVARFNDEERRAMLAGLIDGHLSEIDRRVRAVRMMLAMLR